MRSLLKLHLPYLLNQTSNICTKRRFTVSSSLNETSGEMIIVVGGGAAGVYGAIRAKTLGLNLNVLVIEKSNPLSKVKISGGGRCNVTNGHCADNLDWFPSHWIFVIKPVGERNWRLNKLNDTIPAILSMTYDENLIARMILAEQYPRGNKELKGSFFITHGPRDTMSWFSDQGVELKTEDDGRVFPVSNSSSSIIDCLTSEIKRRGGKCVHEL